MAGLQGHPSETRMAPSLLGLAGAGTCWTQVQSPVAPRLEPHPWASGGLRLRKLASERLGGAVPGARRGGSKQKEGATSSMGVESWQCPVDGAGPDHAHSSVAVRGALGSRAASPTWLVCSKAFWRTCWPRRAGRLCPPLKTLHLRPVLGWRRLE